MKFFQHARSDITAGLVVFLVAIPLCLGIALASGAPLFSGILSGIIGGIVVGSLSGSSVSVSGPAAGMAAVVISIITQLGDFNTFLLALFIGGCLQLIMGFFKAGFVADYVPSNVIQGLLCAIGVLLIIKQLPPAFTHSNGLAELKILLLNESSDGFSLNTFITLYEHLNLGACFISIFSIIFLISFDNIKWKALKTIPSPILVVVFGVLINEFFTLVNSSLAQDTPQLVNIPQEQGFKSLLNQLSNPTWTAWTNPKVYLYGAMIAIVASLETLLNIQAAEKLDKKHQRCSTDRELVAQGTGNILAGLLGGLPITSVIVRTSVNIQSGSKTKASTILHGVFLLIAVVSFPHIINRIPLSSLAAILIYTGYKLTNPRIYKEIYAQGMDRFIPFFATLVGIVMTDLLTGIILGLLVSLFFILKSNSQVRLDIIKEINPTGVIHRLVLPQQITFLNKASLVAELTSIPDGAHLVIDARYSNYIDREILELIKSFQEEQTPHREISLHLIGFKEKYAIHNFIDFINVTAYNTQNMLTPESILTLLKEGNQRLLQDRRIHRSVQDDIRQTAKAQHPIAIILGCIDSRVPVETIFDMSFGDLFCIRIAGNIVNNDILASLEYACTIIGAKLIVVLGHTRCGAIASACDEVKQGHITELLDKIKPAIDAEKTIDHDRSSKNDDFIQKVTHLNVANTLCQIYDHSEPLRRLIKDKKIGLTGALYDVSTGEVSFDIYDHAVKKIRPECHHSIPLLHLP